MSSVNGILSNVNKIRSFSSLRRSFTAGKIVYNKPSSASAKINPSPSVPNVKGLTDACVKVPNEPVGPGAAKNTNYKNPEYFCYDKTSYFEAEVEMLKHRCPQPSTKVPYYPSSK